MPMATQLLNPKTINPKYTYLFSAFVRSLPASPTAALNAAFTAVWCDDGSLALPLLVSFVAVDDVVGGTLLSLVFVLASLFDALLSLLLLMCFDCSYSSASSSINSSSKSNLLLNVKRKRKRRLDLLLILPWVKVIQIIKNVWLYLCVRNKILVFVNAKHWLGKMKFNNDHNSVEKKIGYLINITDKK